VSDDPIDDRSPQALGWALASHVMAISLEMVVPALLGLWIDRKLGTPLVFFVFGSVFGVVAGTVQLLRFAALLRRDAKTGSQGASNRKDRA
jgi:F0F1-type ATP synthase assembly protein I